MLNRGICRKAAAFDAGERQEPMDRASPQKGLPHMRCNKADDDEDQSKGCCSLSSLLLWWLAPLLVALLLCSSAASGVLPWLGLMPSAWVLRRSTAQGLQC
jgi:hypothetical protein